MGCCNEKNSNEQFTSSMRLSLEEEEIIKFHERSLIFSSIKVKPFLRALQKNQNDDELTLQQIQTALSEVNISAERLLNPSTQKLFGILQNQNSLFNSKTIFLCAIVLGVGKSKRKAIILFSMYAQKDKNFINYEEGNVMMQDLLNISINKIPWIALGNKDKSLSYTLQEKQIVEYIKELSKNKNSYIETEISHLFKNKKELSLIEYLEKFRNNSELEDFLTSFRLRLALL
ncbi:hypothetical protein SteCoe_22677 [Stentor coeruleus]|uniref:Uncharacterized protein n=1 Tax=Stentor coeruleus TaxID=5963 RepID=A0A1R2BLH5_9CILI|nr:hypothetical protein SteCoe_22677 [Stentor coeruleus]